MYKIAELAISSSEIVKTYKIGNTTIKICDEAYKDKYPEEIKAILKNCTDIAYAYMS